MMIISFSFEEFCLFPSPNMSFLEKNWVRVGGHCSTQLRFGWRLTKEKTRNEKRIDTELMMDINETWFMRHLLGE